MLTSIHLPSPSLFVDFIEKIVGSKVTVIHGNDMEITGILRGYDTFVNLVMENVEIT